MWLRLTKIWHIELIESKSGQNLQVVLKSSEWIPKRETKSCKLDFFQIDRTNWSIMQKVIFNRLENYGFVYIYLTI